MTIPVSTWCGVAPPPPIEIFGVLRGDTLSARLARMMALELIARGSATSSVQCDLVTRQIVELLDFSLSDGRDSLPGSLNRTKRLRAIKAHILGHLDDPELGLQTVSDHFNISPRYVSDLFQGDGQTMMDYLWDSRLRRAADLLRRQGPAVQIKDVVFRTGFKSPSHFSSRFAEKFGVSPTAFRKQSQTQR
jgi:AraC-like DNA-binding protein